VDPLTPETRSMKTRTSIAFAPLAVASAAFAGSDLVINEFNAVRDDRWLGCGQLAAGETCVRAGESSPDIDPFFGRRIGNGGDWVELVVTRDHADLRGWKIQWVSAGPPSTTGLPTTNGQIIWFADGTVPQGEITFTQAALWSDMRAGTIITITRDTTAQGGLDTDLSFDPCLDDWWINVHLGSSDLLQSTWNVVSFPSGLPTPPSNQKLYVDHQRWWAQILKADGEIAIGLIGEDTGNGMSGVSSNEVGALREDPGPSTTVFSNYQDANASSFGAPNTWKSADPADVGCRRRQNMDPLRAQVLAESCAGCLPLALNEYNAVRSDQFLGGGTAAQDSNNPPGVASDSQFGRILGNGGNWFELVVLSDHLDMRGWTLEWTETGASGAIQLSNAAFWSDLRIGTTVTFIQRTTAQGGLDTDLSFNGTTDTWVNINTFDTTLVTGTTSTKPGHVSGQFTTSNDRWTIRAVDASGSAMTGRMGEGSPAYNGGKVNAEDVCRLRQDPTGRSGPTSWFDDSGSSSTFGRPNTWNACPGTGTVTQSFAALLGSGCEWSGPSNPADLNGDGFVDGNDLGLMLAAWGVCGGASCPADITGDGFVDGNDLGQLLAAWGAV